MKDESEKEMSNSTMVSNGQYLKKSLSRANQNIMLSNKKLPLLPPVLPAPVNRSSTEKKISPRPFEM